ncbi:class I SAM-dependent methyltransferase [Methanosphaerula subterraneus]|uniref:class I SAM-dependent methyltransferase n=1 Tax=Methanosphaerula subterraneus TaxID=3350244 RepID=UPI003F82D40B
MTNRLAPSDTRDLAEHYDQTSDSQFKNGIHLITELGIKKGDRILDLGCGTGRLAGYAGSITGETGFVVGLDPSEHRIRIAQERSRSIPQVSFQVGSDLDISRLPGNWFDAVYLNSAFHHIERHEARRSALAQIRRILKPEGSLGLSDPDQASPSILRIITREILGYYGIHSLDDDGVSSAELESVLGDTGFRIRKVEYIKTPEHYESAQAVVKAASSSHFGNYLSEVPEDLRDQVRTEIVQKLSELQTGSGISMIRSRVLMIAEKLG